MVELFLIVSMFTVVVCSLLFDMCLFVFVVWFCVFVVVVVVVVVFVVVCDGVFCRSRVLR